MPSQVFNRFRAEALIVACLVALPAILFYTILLNLALNIPLLDDYMAALSFLNHMAELRSVSERASYFLAAQHNEYKLFFGRGLVWLQLGVLHHVNFRALCALGNGFILLLAILLWKMFLPGQRNLGYRMALFIPVSWLVFQLQYVETLNWAMPSLANLSVIVFSLAAIYLLVRQTREAFYASLACLVLSIASLGSGFVIVPIGMLILGLNHKFARLFCWLMVSAACIAAYSYRYDVMSSQSQHQHSVLWTIMRPRALYVITFIGNAGALGGPILILLRGSYHSMNVLLSLLLGIALCIFFIALARRGYIRRNPLVSYCVLYLSVTAVGVAGLRSDLGMAQSIASRYRIYSALFLIFAWFAIVEEFLPRDAVPLRRNRLFLIATLSAVLFSLSMDAWGWYFLTQRNQEMVFGMAAFEHHVSIRGGSGPVLPKVGQPEWFDEFDRRAAAILKQSINLEIYQPPPY